MTTSNNENVVTWYNQRQYQTSVRRKFERQLYATTPCVQRLSVEKELEGHNGCVNCLEWNSTGELLASGSDDFHIILWDMLKFKKKKMLSTQHEGNIFSVKFLPYSDDNYVASTSADASIRVQSVASADQTRCYNCHIRRVKRLCVTKQSPFTLWSGSEDGTVREFDLREPHSCSTRDPCRNVLINVNDQISTSAEVKCVQLHPLYPEYIAVGCTDPYLRLYDRRMLSLSKKNDEISSNKNASTELARGCVRYFSPGHLKPEPTKSDQKNKLYVTTYANFSPNGEEIIQNLGGEHVYIYNLKNGNSDTLTSVSRDIHKSGYCKNGLNHRKVVKHKNGYSNGESYTYAKRKLFKEENSNNNSAKPLTDDLPKLASSYKLHGNDAFSQENYYQAIRWYDKALKLAPYSSVLLANKAAALLKRGWDGDTYEAFRLCKKATEIDPTHVKAMYRQIQSLYQLKWYCKAKECIDQFRERFPDQVGESTSFKKLEKDVKKVLDQEHMTDIANSVGESSKGNGRRRRRGSLTVSDEEQCRRKKANDYVDRYVGACNTNTDIKEANFFGNNGQFIIAGSDCGCMLLWDRQSTNLLEAWQADGSIVNCLQPHPSTCMVATSGIDHVIRIWSPRVTNPTKFDTIGKEIEKLVRSNQKRMNTDPLEEMLRSMGYRAAAFVRSDDDDDDDDDDNRPISDQCRTQ